MHGIDAAHRCDIAENDLVRANANNWTVNFEKVLDGLALLQTKNMCGKPKVGNGGVPRTGDGAKGRPEEIVECTDEDVGKEG